jgi:flagellar M-ring protein FliF
MAKNLTSLLDTIPGLRILVLLVGLAGAIAAGIGIYTWSHGPDYTLLFADLGEKDALEVADSLRAVDIPYRLEAGGRGVSVPRAQMDDARMKLAAKGLPRSGGMGAELLRDSQGIGTTPSMESARFQMALETELAKTISSLSPVQGARIHLAIPKPAAFTRDRRPPSASVFVELYPGRNLEKDQVASIVNLVASSVPDLEASHVTVVDQHGRLLTQQESGSDLDASVQQLEYARHIEENLSARVEELLTPMTGAGRVHAKVNADVDFTQTEEAREVYTPDPKKVRSEQTSEQTASGGGSAPQGVPGAASNQPPKSGGTQPPPAIALQASQSLGTQSKQETRNYELDKTISHTRQAIGRIKRLSIAVLVDNLPHTNEKGETVMQPLTDDERKQIETLVRQAVGFDESRGDSVNIMNAAFQHEAEAPIAPTPIWQQPAVLSTARTGAGVLVLLTLILMVVRPTVRQLLSTPLTAQVQALPGGEGGEAVAIGAGGGAVAIGQRSVPAYEDKLALARTAVAQDPKRVAQVVKTWVGSDGS